MNRFSSSDERARSIQRALWIVLVFNLLVTLIKLIVGLTSGALAVVADGFHSIVDSSSNLVGLAGVWISARPADDNHPYGHHKYETVAAFAIGGMLLVAGFEIGKGVIERLFGVYPAPDITPLTLGLMALTFVFNLAVTAYETHLGKKLQSDLLLADAAHTRTDLFVTLSVIGSLIGARYGWLWLDPVVAGLVVVLLFRAAYEILRSTSNVLTDVAVLDPKEIRKIALGVPGAHAVGEVRSRGRTDAAYVDLNVQVSPAMGIEQAHGVASEIERRISQALPGVLGTVVHLEPEHTYTSRWEAMSLTLRTFADGLGIGLHDLHIHSETDGGYTVAAHLEVDANLHLSEAHALANQLETYARHAFPDIREIVTHLEPLPTVLPDEAGNIRRFDAIRQRLIKLADQIAGAGACHNVELHNVDGHITATLHVTQPADQPVVTSHNIAERIEAELRGNLRMLDHVVVHVEPPE